jgi:branched-chain amino acid transport system substrate-binding protein
LSTPLHRTRWHATRHAAAVLSILLAACAAPPPAPLVVRIGHAGPLTGSIGHLGKDNENGARLAIEELNAQGLRIGGRPAQFELVSEDDQADPRQGVAAANRLVAAQVKAVVGHLNSGVSIPASPIYDKAGLPHLSPSATNPRLGRLGHKTSFRMVGDDHAIGVALGRYAVQSLRAQSIAVVDDRTPYGQGMANAFEVGVRQAGGSITGREFFTVERAIPSVLPALRRQAPDLIFFGGMDTLAGPLLAQMKLEGLNAKLIGGDGVCIADLAKLSGGTLADDRVFCAESGDSLGRADPPPATRTFSQAYKKRYATSPQVYSPHAYDAIKLIAAAMVAAGSAEPAQYLPLLAKTQGYAGASGTVSFDETGNNVAAEMTLYSYRAGRRVAIGYQRIGP